MKFIEDKEMLEWYQLWIQAPIFDWDRGNKGKNKKHHIDDDEIESIFYGETLFVGKIIEPMADEDRWLILGKSALDRIMALIATRRELKLRVISCRRARKNERGLYEEK